MFSISEALQGTTWEPQAGMPLSPTCLALSTALIGAVFRQTKKSARLRLHGASLNRVYGAQLLESGPAILCGILGLYALFYTFLALYNSWAFAALTLKVQLILLCWMLGLMLLRIMWLVYLL